MMLSERENGSLINDHSSALLCRGILETIPATRHSEITDGQHAGRAGIFGGLSVLSCGRSTGASFFSVPVRFLKPALGGNMRVRGIH